MKAGWKTVKLGDVTKEFIVPQRDKPKNLCGDIPWCRIEDIDGIYMSSSKSGKGVTAKDVKEMPLRIFPAGTVIVSCSADLGRCAIVSKPLITNQTFLGIAPDETIDAKYLYYLLRSRAEQLNSMATGATIKYLSRDKFSSLEIPLPPLAEQKRIVELLDEAFAGIDEAKAKAEACELSASNLFKSRMQDVFDGHDQAWAKKRLADVADFKNGLNFTRQSNGQTLQMVGVGDFQDRSVVPKALQSVTIDGNLPDDYLLRRNDILTVRSNGSKDLVGRCMLVPELSAPTSFSGFIIRIRLDASAVSARFFLHFMKSSGTRDRLMRDGGGANISNINQAKLSELPVSLPPLAQQEEIADQLDAHHELSLMLANRYRRKINAIDSLRTSALQRAFDGELTA